MLDALRLIITRSPAAAGSAMKALQAVHARSPIVNSRYASAVDLALNDPGALFTAEERELLISHLPTDTGSREFTLRVRLTEPERQALQEAADAAGQTMSDYVRSKVFGQE